MLRTGDRRRSGAPKENASKGKDAFRICQERIASHELPMKLIDVEYTFDNSKVIFYFTAEKRVDFRNLVKDLAQRFRSRIELRQIGVRDEAKTLGGYGICGRPLCCADVDHRFRSRLDPPRQGAKPLPQPGQDIGSVRPPQVLPSL